MSKKMGFQWGSYSNEGGCEVADCNIASMNASRYRCVHIHARTHSVDLRV